MIIVWCCLPLWIGFFRGYISGKIDARKEFNEEQQSYDVYRRKYRARIWNGKKDLHIGYFTCPVVALNEYDKVEKEVYGNN
jgi:hypothetical protein